MILDGAPLRVWNLAQAQEKLGIGGNFIATSYTSAAPTGGTAAPWKLGDIVVGAVTPDATRYVLIEVGGVPVKLIVAT